MTLPQANEPSESGMLQNSPGRSEIVERGTTGYSRRPIVDFGAAGSRPPDPRFVGWGAIILACYHSPSAFARSRVESPRATTINATLKDPVAVDPQLNHSKGNGRVSDV